MTEPEIYDVVVIGAGPAGENIAQYATETSGLTAVLIERELVGGECSYYACMPSKALLRPIEIAATASHLQGLSAPTIDRDALLARRDYWVSSYSDKGQVDWAEGAGIAVVRGEARLTGERQVKVGDRVIEARHAVVLATGSEAVVPDLYASVAAWGSRDATGIVEVPDLIVVVGGGVVACEAATWLTALGASVTMLVRGDRLLPRAEPFAAELTLKALRAVGVEVRVGVEVTGCRRDMTEETGIGRIHGGQVTVTTADGEIAADEILVGVGRKPRLYGVGLEALGIDPGQPIFPDWLLSVGDSSGEAPLTHWGKYRARVLGEQLAARVQGDAVPKEPEDVPVPQVVFTDPQVAWVGLTEAEARARYGTVDVVQVPWSAASGAALLRDDVEGAAQLVVDPTSRTVVGATFVGPEAGELLHAATIAIVGRVPVHVLRHAVPSYPTASELWLRLLEELPREYRKPV